jgi:sterol desaturase/sphingolipid hydroxylase (fatty acid hydroxylase superfamily)
MTQKPNPLTQLRDLTQSHGAMTAGQGLITGVIALSLGILCFLGVLAFHFPEYLTTPQLRQSYNVAVIRNIMLAALVIGGGLSLVNIIMGRARWLSTIAFLLIAVTALLGGHKVPVSDFADNTPYIGLDWFILDLLGSSLIFIFIEKLFAHRKDQPIFRPEWQTDFQHFVVNHMVVGFMLLATNLLVHKAFGWAVKSDVQAWMWRLHAVHHSAKYMDWMAGSRLHIIEVLITRTTILGGIFILGFSKEVIDAYIVIVGFQAVFNHCNVNVRLGPLRYIIVTPNFHHWHHSQDKEALDTNYAAHFAFLDYLFGTAAKADRIWPDQYGVLGDYVPNGFWAQLKFPFTWKG